MKKPDIADKIVASIPSMGYPGLVAANAHRAELAEKIRKAIAAAVRADRKKRTKARRTS